MSRAWLVVLVTALVAGGIATAATLVLTNSDENLAFETPWPSPSPLATTEAVAPSPTKKPKGTGQPPGTATAAPAAPATAAPAPAPTAVAASSVNCAQTPTFCSSTTGGMSVNDKRLVGVTSTKHDTDYSRVPTTEMTWRVLGPGEREAKRGDEVEGLHVEVVVRNDTSDRTFVSPRREVALTVFRNGAKFDELATKGEPFEMPPGGLMRATYDVPISADGTYEWRAKTWFYEKR